MMISGIVRARFGMDAKNSLTLTDGQIIQGKIVKLFPENRAEVQIGSERFVAEIATSLRAGERYFFQVQHQKDRLVHLKVLQTANRVPGEQSASSILTLLGVPATKANVQFFHMVMNERIPFEPSQLISAAMLIREQSSSESLLALKEMIKYNLPMTEPVLQALLQTKTMSVTMAMNELSRALEQTPKQSQTEKNLAVLLDRLLKPSPANEFSYKQLEIRPSSFIKRTQFAEMVSLSGAKSRYADATAANMNPSIPFIAEAVSSESASEFVKHAGVLQAQAGQLAKMYPVGMLVSQEKMAAFKNMAEENIFPLLPPRMKMEFAALLTRLSPDNQTELFEVVKLLSERDIYQAAEAAKMEKRVGKATNIPLQAQFLSFLHRYIESFGINEEAKLKNLLMPLPDLPNQNQLHTIKSYLLQIVQDGNSEISEKAQPLLHMINGLQLQSVQESSHFLLASLQMPGKKFALNNDLHLQFEGRKTKDGTLDPDFCRILFILHLQRLEETIIDMQVQKRLIAITIYNDNANIKQVHMESMKKVLENNLELIDYRLSVVKWKPFQEKAKRKQGKIQEVQTERFDVRI